jgi:hypothetical protein
MRGYFDHSTFRYIDISTLRKEHIAYRYGSDDTGQVSQQAAADGMAGILNTHGTEVHR